MGLLSQRDYLSGSQDSPTNMSRLSLPHNDCQYRLHYRQNFTHLSQQVQPDTSVKKIRVQKGKFLHVPCRLFKCEGTGEDSKHIYSVPQSISLRRIYVLSVYPLNR
jgi:hypothetical protein